MKEILKSIPDTLLKTMVLKHRERYLVSVDKHYCDMHKEWQELTTQEKNDILKRDRYAMKIFKNIWGGGTTICI